MYYSIGKCVMRKSSLYALPTMLCVAETVAGARRLAKTLDSGGAALCGSPSDLKVTLTIDKHRERFRLYDVTAVNSLMAELMRNNDEIDYLFF